LSAGAKFSHFSGLAFSAYSALSEARSTTGSGWAGIPFSATPGLAAVAISGTVLSCGATASGSAGSRAITGSASASWVSAITPFVAPLAVFSAVPANVSMVFLPAGMGAASGSEACMLANWPAFGLPGSVFWLTGSSGVDFGVAERAGVWTGVFSPGCAAMVWVAEEACGTA
jgi:hypothetical protein